MTEVNQAERKRKLRTLRCTAFLLAGLLLVGSSPTLAEEAKPEQSQGDLAAKATNPLGNLVSVQFQYQYNISNYNSDGWSDAVIVQPVVPLKLPWKSVPLIITRTTLPAYVTTPEVGGLGHQYGVGDLVNLSLAVPSFKLKGQTIGIGPATTVRTASSEFTGSGKWQVGPALIYINQNTKSVQWGILGWYSWSIAGDDDREDVSKLFYQPFYVKHFGKGAYVGTLDLPFTYNARNGKFTLPLGVKLGKIIKIAKLPLNVFGEGFYSPLDDGASTQWGVKASIAFLFPN
jgi:hypothetical protein